MVVNVHRGYMPVRVMNLPANDQTVRITVLTWSRALGDTLLLVPALRAIRGANPEGLIRLICGPEPGQLLSRAGLADEVGDNSDPRLALLAAGVEGTPAADYAGRESARVGQPHEVRRKHGRAATLPGAGHCGADWVGAGESTGAAGVLNKDAVKAALGGPELVVGFVSRTCELMSGLELVGIVGLAVDPIPPPGVHAAEHFERSLEAVGIPSLWEGAEAVAPVVVESPNVPSHGVLIHPGSGATWKCAPPEIYREVAAGLARIGRPVAVLEGPADAGRIHAMEWKGEIVRAESMVELAHTLQNFNAFVGNDSGVSHLSGLLGVPTVALFGPTHPDTWRPLGPNVRIIRTCSREPESRIRVCEDPHCMAGIEASAVIAATVETIKPVQE